jgi:putative membrane protein
MKSFRLLALLPALIALPAFAQTVSDAQIAAIVVTANQVDIDAGAYASAHTDNADVKGFADRMVADHTGVNKDAVALVTKLHVTPEESDTSRALKSGGDENLTHLKSLSGKELDKAYIDHEVAYHEAVINALDQVLIPNAQNAELKAMLVGVRPAFVAHLEHAKHVQATYK